MGPLAMVLLVLVARSATAQQLDIADLVDLRFPGLGLQREASTTTTTTTTTTYTTKYRGHLNN